MANEPLDRELFLQGKQTPVLFGTALGNFGVDHVLDAFMNWAPEPKAHQRKSVWLKQRRRFLWLCI